MEGYSPNSFYGTQCGSKYQNYEVYDYQALITTHAEYSVCRDRSFPYSDNCSQRGLSGRPAAPSGLGGRVRVWMTAVWLSLRASFGATPWMLRVLGAARACAPPGWSEGVAT